jgi:hypothetical protein
MGMEKNDGRGDQSGLAAAHKRMHNLSEQVKPE